MNENKCTDPELKSDCSGCTDRYSEGTHQMCTKQHGHYGCDLDTSGHQTPTEETCDGLCLNRTKDHQLFCDGKCHNKSHSHAAPKEEKCKCENETGHKDWHTMDCVFHPVRTSGVTAPKEYSLGWEEELQFGVMEDYLNCVEMEAKYESRDKAKYLEEMRGHWNKLKDLFRIQISKAKEEGAAQERKRIREVIEGVVLKSTMPDRSVNRIEYEDGYNTALTDLLEAIEI